ncbi:MAG: hypothetical protein K6A30_08335 [Lachnospiraceae bacterium]|nr:hypothetical protein [Lachnospiraceae bacterium]
MVEKIKEPYLHELDELTVNINLMAKELSGMDHMRKDFVSNVSHEMKTPVSSMMAMKYSKDGGLIQIFDTFYQCKVMCRSYLTVIVTPSKKRSVL